MAELIHEKSDSVNSRFLHLTMELVSTKLGRWGIRDLVVGLNPIRLPSAGVSDLKMLPDASAIYFFVFGSQVAYVGNTQRLLKRFPSHHHMNDLRRTKNARVSYLIVPDDPALRKRIEKAFIQRIHPALNVCFRTTPYVTPYRKVDRRRQRLTANA